MSRPFFQPCSMLAMVREDKPDPPSRFSAAIPDRATPRTSKPAAFFVAMNQVGRILGSGGWTCRRPDYATGFGENPVAEALPTVRGVFVDPAAERRGIASSLMAWVEQDAVENGIEAIFLTATLPGAALYERLGYQVLGREPLSLNNDIGFACVRMMKRLKAANRQAA